MAESNNNMQNEISKIEAIKDIIFGQDQAEINRRIHALEEKVGMDIGNLNESLVEVIEKLEATLLTRIEKSEATTQKALDSLKEAKTDRVKLGNMLIKMGESLKK